MKSLTEDKSLDIKQAMRVFNQVQTHGEKRQGRYYWRQLEASSDFDGYTLYLNYQNVKLSLFFHNSYHISFNTRQELDQFYQLLANLDR